jgi:hypothetical protein
MVSAERQQRRRRWCIGKGVIKGVNFMELTGVKVVNRRMF